MSDVSPTRPRGRPPLHASDDRGDMRPEMREDDPRARAAKRAAEIMENIGDLDVGSDEFAIDAADVPDGWDYEWKTQTVLGKEDPGHQVALARTGWEPVPASRHPAYMPRNTPAGAVIERKGMVLMERPLELTRRVREIDHKNARDQVRSKEQQLSSAPQGQFERTHKDSSLVKVRKSYEAIPIPE